MLTSLLIASIIPTVASFMTVPLMTAQAPSGAQLSRTGFVKQGLAVAASAGLVGVVAPHEASADVPEVGRANTRLGGLLEPYTDISKGFKMSYPLGWTKFDTLPGVYEIKFQDIVNPAETVIVTQTPVKTTTQLTDLGDVKAVGEKLASSRNMILEDSRERITEGIRFYDFVFKGERMMEVRSLSVYKGKLWGVTATSSERNWSKRETPFKTIMQSFVPRL